MPSCMIIPSSVEHPAVMVCLRQLQNQGLATFTAVGVDPVGRVDPAAVEAALTPSTVLVTIMHSNNEACAGEDRGGGRDREDCGEESRFVATGFTLLWFHISSLCRWALFNPSLRLPLSLQNASPKRDHCSTPMLHKAWGKSRWTSGQISPAPQM